jgi:CDP-diacylglycerol--serine O-phosphatidyltransferase
MKIKRHLPNALTSLNLVCGTGALMCAVDGRMDLLPLALALIVAALFFDLMDGRVARKLNVASPIGLELDSLADLISFGVAPAMLLWKFRFADGGALGAVAALAFVLAGAFRLARFNVLSQQGQPATKYFVGMPIPAAASIALTAGVGHSLPGFGPAVASDLVALSTLGAAALMVSTIRFPSPKVLPLGKKSFTVGLAAAVAMGIVMLQGRFALISLGYVALGLAMAAGRRVKALRPRSAPAAR